MFDQLKMMKQARDMQKKMEAEVMTDSFKGVEITINGKQEVLNITINDESLLEEKNSLEKILKEAFNNAVRKSQMEMAKKMREDMGSMFGM